jgi:hypothetical protein
MPLIRRPVEPCVLVVRLPAGDTVVLWGPDEDDADLDVIAVDGRALHWPDAESCIRDAHALGIAVIGDEPVVQDLRVVGDWLAGRCAALDPSVALNAWNLAGDVAVSVGAPWHDRGRTADDCHDKLTIASVPYLADLESYTPRWKPHELRYLRARLGLAMGLLRTHIT